MKARKQGWILTVTTCPQFGMRPQVDISKTQIAQFGGIKAVKRELNQQAVEAGRPLAAVDFNGAFTFKSENWPK